MVYVLLLVRKALSKITSIIYAKVAMQSAFHARVVLTTACLVTLPIYFLGPIVSQLAFHRCTMSKATAAKCAQVPACNV